MPRNGLSKKSVNSMGTEIIRRIKEAADSAYININWITATMPIESEERRTIDPSGDNRLKRDPKRGK